VTNDKAHGSAVVLVVQTPDLIEERLL